MDNRTGKFVSAIILVIGVILVGYGILRNENSAIILGVIILCSDVAFSSTQIKPGKEDKK